MLGTPQFPRLPTVHIVTQWSGSGGTECFDAVGWVIWPVKIVPEMTYKVSSGTLNFCSLTGGTEAYLSSQLASFGALTLLVGSSGL